jgi:DNA polymerase-3 subunit gamma/tau
LAPAAGGSLRDAQSLLDQAIASLGTHLETERVADLLGLVRADVLAEAAEAILARDAAGAVRLVDRIAAHGQDLRQFTQELTAHLRDLMILKVCPEPGALLEGVRVGPEICRRQAEQATLPELELMIRALQQVEGEMRRATQPRLHLEMALLRLTQIRHLHGLGEVLGRIVSLEARLSNAPPAEAPELPLFGGRPPSTERPARTAQAAESVRPAGVGPAPEQGGVPEAAAGWAAAVSRLRGRKRLASVLTEARPVALEADTLTLEVANGNAFVRDTLEDPDSRRLIAETATQIFGRRVRIEYRFAAAGPPRLEPAEGRPALSSAPHAGDHPLVREALVLFGGTVVRELGA